VRTTALLLFVAGASVFAQEPKPPETAPPPELVGRWLEKTSLRKGDLVGYNVYCFSRKSEFLVLTRVRNEKTQRWVETTRLYGKARNSLVGYFEATGTDSLRFNVVVLAMAVLPVEVQYRARGDTLVLSKDLFDPTADREVHCERVGRLPGESAEEFAAFRARLDGGLNGPEFRRIFEHAAHEMKEHPRDDEMIANLSEHRAELEKLREMIQADQGLERVDYEWTKPADPASVGVSPERIAVYRELCRRVGLERGIEAFGGAAERVRFLASTRGLSISGSSKSYVWLREPPQTTDERVVVNDLEAYLSKRRDERRVYFAKHKRAMSNGSFDALRHVEGNWYLEYEFED
jgi:hypothetical protein